MDRCFLCKSKQKDDIQYGEFLKNKHYGVHTFCLYLSSNLSQNGKDDEGFLGFLEADIKKEEKRISFLKCCYCHEKYANIGCCERRCRNTFHLVCGVNNYCENKFCNDYRSYCHRHVRKVQQRPSTTETCLICYDSLCTPQKKFKSVNMILTPCCRNGWFHKLCLQKFAKTAGYFFKCPLCNDADIFRKKLPDRGIFIPNQDAAWELEPNAFAELLERPSVCSALECKNKKGPTSESDHNPFVMCRTCGSKAMHKLCLAPGLKSFYCNDCTIALEEGDSGRESLNSQNNNNADEEDDDVDVCHVSDKEDLEIVKHLIAGSNHDQPDSDSHSDNKSIKPSSSRQRRILSSDLEPSDREHLQKNEIIMPCNSKHPTKLATMQRRDGIQSECQTKTITHGNLTHNSETESSEDFLIVKTNRKRKSFIIPSDSEDEDEHSTAKQVCFDKKNTPEVEDDSSDEDDDDPLENFHAILQKQKNIQKSQCKENTKGLDTVTDDNKNKDDKYKRRPSLQTKNHENKTLDISCIAKRTRRRQSMHALESQRSNLQNCKENPQKRLDISCIAVRTRRRTVCSQSAKEYFQQRPYEMSQIYEKVHQSEYESETTTTDDESVSDATTTTSDLNDFIVDDGYEEKDCNFEISCIANRTRKRKSVRALKIQTILEETENDDENELSSASNSTSSTSKQTGVALNNFRTHRKRCKQRILSTSSEESTTEHLNTKKPSLAHTKYLEKISTTRNMNNFLMPKCGSLNNHPHSHHRKRL